MEFPAWKVYGRCRLFGCAFLVLWPTVFLSDAFAQVLRTPETVVPDRPGEFRPTPAPPPEIDIEKSPPADRVQREWGGSKVQVKKFRFTGNTVYDAERLEELVRSEEGKELTLDELRSVAGRVSDFYSDHGYILARAYLPPQDIRDGVIEIAVIEGYVGNVEVTGNQRYSANVIKRAMTRVKNAKLVSEPLLETALNLLNEYPGLNVRATLKPGENRGESDIVLTAQEAVPVTVMVDVDDYGSKYTGIWRYGTELTYGNLTGQGDRLSVRGITSANGSSADLYYVRAAYGMPIGGYGTKLEGAFVYSENGVGAELAPLGQGGTMYVGSFNATQPIFLTAAKNLMLTAGFDYVTVENTTQHGQPIGKDDLRIFRLGVSGDYRDSWLGRTYYGLTWRQGVPWFGANPQNDPGATISGTPGSFSIFQADLARTQSLVYGGSYLVLRGTGQLSTQNLPPVEQFVLGGYYTVRGFSLGQYAGDNGYALTAEVVVPVPYLRDWVQMVGFIDNGGIAFVSPDKAAGQKTQFATGAGGGLRFNVPIPWVVGAIIQMRLDYAVPFKPNMPGLLYFSARAQWY